MSRLITCIHKPYYGYKHLHTLADIYLLYNILHQPWFLQENDIFAWLRQAWNFSFVGLGTHFCNNVHCIIHIDLFFQIVSYIKSIRSLRCYPQSTIKWWKWWYSYCKGDLHKMHPWKPLVLYWFVTTKV